MKNCRIFTTGKGRPLKGVSREKTPPHQKKQLFFLLHFGCFRLGPELLIILFRASYFRLWFAGSLTRISHPSGSRQLCFLLQNTAPSALADQKIVCAMPVPIVCLQTMWLLTNPFVVTGIGESK
jgi:hypothetical protein